MAEIISGKIVSQKLRSEIKTEVIDFKAQTGRAPGLAVIVVGSDPASAVYVRNKHKACLDVGIESYQIEYPEDVSEDELLSKISELNLDKKVDGILVQLPLPAHINEEKVLWTSRFVSRFPRFLAVLKRRIRFWRYRRRRNIPVSRDISVI